MFTRRQVVVASTTVVPTVGLLGLPTPDPVRREVGRMVVLAEALIALPLSSAHRKWATTIRELVPHMPASTDPDSAYVRECRASLSPIMGYSEFLGLHHPADNRVQVLTKEITAATARIEMLLVGIA